MSLFADYIKEREGKETLEIEGAFAIYEITPGHNAYIQDIYVVPELRQKGIAARLANKILEKAKSQGCKAIYGSIDRSANNAEASEQTLIAYGMRFSHEHNGIEYFSKGI